MKKPGKCHRCLVAGLFQAALLPLKKQTSAVRGRLLHMLSVAFEALVSSRHLHSAALTVLVEGGAVELALDHMAQAELDKKRHGAALLVMLLIDSRAMDRARGVGDVDPVMTGLVKLLKVRNVLSGGATQGMGVSCGSPCLPIVHQSTGVLCPPCLPLQLQSRLASCKAAVDNGMAM